MLMDLEAAAKFFGLLLKVQIRNDVVEQVDRIPAQYKCPF